MKLRLYNSLTRRKEDFVPEDPARVRIYVCGPTVYDYAHVGNARPVVVFDLLFRLLRRLYSESHVVYVRNITDVDDKINARAAEEKVPIRELTERTARQFHDDMSALGVLTPTVEPRATEHISAMIALIERLIARGNAYVAEGHVLFHVPSMPDYGELSARPLDEMIAGARVDVAPYKKDAMDFVLWKPSPPDLPGWESPWGRGRPGWHIECSAMAWKHLGERFDIHGGGIDLIFPHHENEIAQSRSAFAAPVMANIWMHNGYLQVEGQKMAKSRGNFVTVHELLTKWRGFAWPGAVIKFALLTSHYRQPMDFTQDLLEQAAITLSQFATFGFADSEASPSEEFLAALCDDLNTPRAISELHRLHGVSRTGVSLRAEWMSRPGALIQESNVDEARQLAAGLQLLGIDIDSYDKDWVQKQAELALTPALKSQVEALVAARNTARVARNWSESDRIRDELAAMGVALKDHKDGTTTWELKR